SAVLAARALLSSLTPLKADCGRLCAGACCQGDEATGMLLFPGEAQLYASCGFAKVVPAHFALGGENALLLVCQGRCPREERPLACRLFPLFLRLGPGRRPRVVMDPRARTLCPLTDYGMEALDPAFVSAARAAYGALLEDEACALFLGELSEAFTL
ncbi:MAG: hypothetical protein Q4G52_10855, partial [Clostridia bacterium]|nr:hypothetical protein [Clostridia bacterium]